MKYKGLEKELKKIFKHDEAYVNIVLTHIQYLHNIWHECNKKLIKNESKIIHCNPGSL